MVTITEEALAEALATMREYLNERQRRLMLGALAVAVGPGGIGVLARAAGVSRSTVSTGAGQVREGSVPRDGRARRPGAGRPRVSRSQPGIEDAVRDLVEPTARGDPCALTRWTSKSARWVVKGLVGKGFRVATSTARRLVRGAGYRLQKLFKTKEEKACHPDRDAQFEHINTTVAKALAAGEPVLSADTKKRELVGEYINNGREWQPAGAPEQVNGHDFPTGVAKAIPYGIYDVGANTGFVVVGTDHDTSAFAVNAFRTWWQQEGQARYPHSTTLTITVDGGGSNGYRPRAWKIELATLAAEIGRDITVCHYSPGTSKWNKIEHRLFSFISINWRGRALTDYETILNTIAHTTTDTGLRVTARLDTGTYPTGVKITKRQFASIPITRQRFHGEWNYTVSCRPLQETVPPNDISLVMTD